jgi:hypothetical protein
MKMPLRRVVRTSRFRLLLLFLPLAAIFGASQAMATDYYVCDCAAGADPQCSMGDDASTGTTMASAWRSYARARDAFAGLAPGDGLNFCRGGVFPISGGNQWVNSDCRADAPCTIGAYAATWGIGDEARPRISQSSGHGFAFANGGDPAHEEGYVLRDIELACSGCVDGDWGVFFFNDIDDVSMQRLHIHGFQFGVHLAGSNGCATEGCDRSNERISLQHSEITDNFGGGWLGADNELLIADNRFLRNGTGSVFEHNLYLSQSGGPTHDVRVLHNELYRSAAAGSGSCQGGSFTVHGEHTDLLIEGNLIHEDLGAADPACWGLGVVAAYASAEGFVRAVIRGNTLRNMGNVAIALGSCQDCIVENNLIEHEQAFGVVAILAPALARGAEDLPMSNLTVRNNSVFTHSADSTAIRVGDEGSAHVIVSNALQSSAVAGGWACLSLDLAAANYSAVNNNVCGFVVGGGREWEQGSGSLAAWQTASGLDLDSVAANPGFAAAGAPDHDLRAATATAPMVAAGHPSLSAPLEFLGGSRGLPADAGAWQYGSGDVIFVNGFDDPAK